MCKYWRIGHAPQASSDFLNIYVQYLEREEEKIISYLEYFAVVLAEGGNSLIEFICKYKNTICVRHVTGMVRITWG